MASHYTTANEAFIDENYDLALSEYTKAIEEQPTAEYYSKRAACYLKVGEPLSNLSISKQFIGLNLIFSFYFYLYFYQKRGPARCKSFHQNQSRK